MKSFSQLLPRKLNSLTLMVANFPMNSCIFCIAGGWKEGYGNNKNMSYTVNSL